MCDLERRKRTRRHVESSSRMIQGPQGSMDLFVPVPKNSTPFQLPAAGTAAATNPTINPSKSMVHPMFHRLQEAQFEYIAWTHIVHGRPRDPDDRSKFTLPDRSYFESIRQVTNHVTCLRRIHVIVDNLSDMVIFTSPSASMQELLDEYDLVSIAPRTEAVFQSACTCDAIDIVTLDGSTSTSNTLPYSLRSVDIRSIRDRNAILEIPYAVPVLNRAARKGWIQTCRSVITASLGGRSDTSKSVPILFSSGSRSCNGGYSNGKSTQTDLGPLAIRTPGDLVNLLHAVLGLDPQSALNSVTKCGQVALNHARKRRLHGRKNFSTTYVARIIREKDSEFNCANQTSPKPITYQLTKSNKKRPLENDNDDDDGFIAF
jgi:RNase P/RNase MRP subunit p30